MKTESTSRPKQYRVVFTQLANVNGDMRPKTFSTKWFDSRMEAESSRWMREDNATIIERP